MPKLVAIDDDVYEFLRRSVSNFRETESAVLRRLLGVPTPGTATAPGGNHDAASTAVLAGAGGPGEPYSARPSATPLARFVNDPAFRLQGSATDKFLKILGFAYQQDPTDFHKVLQLSGRHRKYFAGSREEVAKSGTSTHPRRIPGSEYWVLTNAATHYKCGILRRTLKILGYSDDDIKAADAAVY